MEGDRGVNRRKLRGDFFPGSGAGSSPEEEERMTSVDVMSALTGGFHLSVTARKKRERGVAALLAPRAGSAGLSLRAGVGLGPGKCGAGSAFSIFFEIKLSVFFF